MHAPPLPTPIGREPELTRLRSALRPVLRGRAGWLELCGDPGIGKTRLLGELCRSAEQQGMLVLGGHATEPASKVPFAALIDALDDHVAVLGRERVSRLSRGRADELALMLPALGGPSQARTPMLGDERYTLHHAVRALLEGLAGPRPVLLAFDDMHWADAATIELVAYLVRRLPVAPVLLALAYRPRQAPAELARSLARGEPLERIAVGPLSPEAARQLVGDRVPKERHVALYAESGGNPLFLEALAGASGAPRSSAPGQAALPEVPGAILAALADEIDALPPTARTYAMGAATAGDPFTPELAAATAALGEIDALAALDALVAVGVVLPTGVPRQFCFRHPLVSRALYERAGAGWRLAAHGRAAAALEQMGAPIATRAHHVALSAVPGDDAAVALLAAATREQAGRAPAVAAAWAAAALRLLPADSADPRRLDLLVTRATALGAAGRLHASRDALREVLSALPASLPALRACVVAFIAQIEQLLGRQEEAHDLLCRTLAEQPDPDSQHGTSVRIELARERFFAGDRAGMRTYAAAAYDVARRLPEPPLLAAAAGMLALAEYYGGRLPRAAALLDEAAGHLDALADGQLAGRLDAAFFVAWCEQSMERWEGEQRHAVRGLAVARATGQGHLLLPLKITRAITLTWQGELARAACLAEEAIDAAMLGANDQALAWALTLRCWIAALVGDVTDAIRHGEEAVATARRLPQTFWSGVAGCRLAEARLEDGDCEAARAGLLAAAGGPDLPLVERGFQAHWYEVLTRAELGCGSVRQAGRWASRADATARGLGLDGRTSEALRARAAVLLAVGEPARGAARFEDAAAAALRAGNRLDHARALMLAGGAHAAAGVPAVAEQQLRHAESVLDACGARRWRDQAAKGLRSLGVPVARQGRRGGRAAGGLEALTDRERELAELVSAGHTNRDIAARLHLSQKTVETHLANIFAKLEVRSRSAVAVAIARAAAPPA